MSRGLADLAAGRAQHIAPGPPDPEVDYEEIRRSEPDVLQPR